MVDASVAVRWFELHDAARSASAQELLEEYNAGRLRVVVPPLLFLELLNVAGRHWGWSQGALVELVTRVEGLSFDVAEPDLDLVAVWVSRGLTAYDAAYVALAEQRGAPLITDDRHVLTVAAGIARSTLAI